MQFDPTAYEEDLKFLARFKRLSESRDMPADQVKRARAVLNRATRSKKLLEAKIVESLAAVVKVASQSDVDGAKRVAEIAKSLSKSAGRISSDLAVAKLMSTPSGAMKMAKAISEGKAVTADAVSVAKSIASGAVMEVNYGTKKKTGTGTFAKRKRLLPRWRDILSSLGEIISIDKNFIDRVSAISTPERAIEANKQLLVLQAHAKIIKAYSKWRGTGLNTDTVAGIALFLESVLNKPREAIDDMSFKAKDGKTYRIGMMRSNPKNLIKFLDMEVGAAELREMLKTQAYIDKLEQLSGSQMAQQPGIPHQDQPQQQGQAPGAN